MAKRKTIILSDVIKEAEKIVEFIRNNSPQNAEKFKQELKNKISQVELNPEGYPSENYLNKVRILYRFALVMHSWKLVFKVTKNY